MYRKKGSPEEQLFCRLLLRELHRYCQNGARIYAEGREFSPEEVIANYIAESPGQYMVRVDRDGTGTVTCLHFFPARPEDFSESGRWNGGKISG